MRKLINIFRRKFTVMRYSEYKIVNALWLQDKIDTTRPKGKGEEEFTRIYSKN